MRIATKEEIKSYRNWALNPHDLQHFTGAYPHASANVEREMMLLLLVMRLTVPSQSLSWAVSLSIMGINQQLDAALKLNLA